jgi:hypothetical protein
MHCCNSLSFMPDYAGTLGDVDGLIRCKNIKSIIYQVSLLKY